MKKLITVWIVLLAILHAAETLTPTEQIVVAGTAKDIVADGAHLYIGTDMGRLQVYDYTAKAFVYEIALPDIRDFMGDSVPPRVFSIDYKDGRYLLVSDSGVSGYSDIWIHENNQSTRLLSHEEKKVIVKGRFIDKDHILLGYLSNEAALYDIRSRKELYRVQLSESKFSDFALSEDHTKAVYGCESGVLSLIDTASGKVLQVLKGINKDNTYKVAYRQGIIAAAGQDRRGAIYRESTGKGDFIEGNFLIYATGLSPSAKLVAFAMDEQNNISVYDTASHTKLYYLKGQKSTLNAIVFTGETTLFSASDDNTVMAWKLQ